MDPSVFRRDVLLIINPTSGKMTAKTGTFEIVNTLSALGVIPNIYITQKALDAKNIVRETADRYESVICCGGDGTLNEVISGMIEGKHATPIGYIPCGTTNDYASALAIPKSLTAAAEISVTGIPTAQDIGRFCGKRYFTYIASFGMLTSVSYATPQNLKNVLGHLAYLIEGAKSLTEIKSYRVRIETENGIKEDNYLFGAVTNTNSIGGICKLSPDQVDLHDGRFESFFIRYPKKLTELNLILNCLRTSTPDPEVIDCFSSARFKIVSETSIAWTTDGEFAGEFTEATVENLPNAATILLFEDKATPYTVE